LKLQASMLDEVSNAIIVVDKKSIVSYWNKQAEVLYKFHKSEMVGHRNSGKIIAPASLSAANEAMRQLQYEGYWRGELTMQRKDGSTFIALVSNRALLDEKGDFAGFIGVSTDITELKRIQNTLESSVHEKEVLLKEIHHRVKNNMQIISSLLHLQALQSEDPLINEVLVESQSRVRSMSMVHEKLYKSVDLSKVSLADYINELAEELLHTWTGTKLQVNRHFNLNNIELSIEQAIPCGLLLNELISNAIKHGFNRHEAGNLYIRLYNENSHVCIEVANDGTKLPETFDFKQTETLGTQLIDSLTEQLMGTIVFERDPITKFTVKFPNE
jgi:PAS domain S-box-containing protein